MTDLRFQVRDGWGSHIPSLLEAFAASDGPVLEFGAGHFSTPLLHSLCAMAQRPLVTLESDETWLDVFRGLEGEGHTFHLMDATWSGWRNITQSVAWGLVFVDHAPDRCRTEVVEAMRGRATVVLHDAERMRFKKLRDRHPHTMDMPAGMPATAVFSP